MDKQSSQNKPPAPPKKKKKTTNFWRVIWTVLQVFLVLGTMLILFAGAAAAGFFASYVKDEPLRTYEEIYEELYAVSKTGEAYFKDNEFIGYLRSPDVSQPITVNEVSPHLINAILASEDNEFYKHEGVNIKGLSRAVLEQITSPGQGTGGSTITQQLVKKQLLTSDRKLERKFKELLLAMRIERMFPKDQILEGYMNMVYLGYNANGSNVYGVRAAAEGIFGIPIKDLNIAQSAYIAGMIQVPGRFTPFTRSGVVNETNLENGLQRMDYVLKRLLETERITQAEYNEAKAFDIRASLAEKMPGMMEKYPFLTFEIERRAVEILAEQNMEKAGESKEELSAEAKEEYIQAAQRQLTRGGYKIYTTIDRALYDAFHETIANEKLFSSRSKKIKYTYIDPETGEEKEQGYLEQAAATLIDNQTGAIIAMVEGRDFDELQYNLNTVPRQPGSSIKPILDYAPALELGVLQPASVLDDSPIFMKQADGKYWTPQNFNNKYHGLMTVRHALAQSYNLPAIKAFQLTQEKSGANVPFDFLKKMGITTLDKEDLAITAVAIGGMKYGLTVEENTGAFSTFANGGVFIKPYLIERIETLEGDLVYNHELKPERIFSEQTSFLMNDMLKSVVNNGTARSVRNEMGAKLEIAGKTGTTNSSYDSWFVGYTPQVSMGVWLGYPKLESLSGAYGVRSQKIWAELMKTLKEVRPEYVNEEQKFEQPNDIVRRTVCSKSGKLPSELCKAAGYLVDDYFNRAFIPTEVDDSLVNGRMVIVNGKKYLAHETTPDDFVTTRVFVKREPLNIPESYLGQKERYLPLDWDSEAPTEADPRVENGKVPDPPSGLKVEWRDQHLAVFWNPTPEDDIAGYRLYQVTPNGQKVKKASIPAHEPNSFNDEQAKQGEVYGYQVTAVDIAGQESTATPIVFSSSISGEEFFTSGKPGAPTELKASQTSFGVDLQWNVRPESEQVKHYVIYYSTDPVNGFSKLDESVTPRYVHTILVPLGEYYYHIKAINENGESKESNTVKVSFSSPTPRQDQPTIPVPSQQPENEEENLFNQLP